MTFLWKMVFLFVKIRSVIKFKEIFSLNIRYLYIDLNLLNVNFAIVTYDKKL